MRKTLGFLFCALIVTGCSTPADDAGFQKAPEAKAGEAGAGPTVGPAEGGPTTGVQSTPQGAEATRASGARGR